MGTFLLVLGVIWGVLGLANVAMMDWSDPGAMKAFVVIFNVVFFIAPAAVLIGIGSWMAERKANRAVQPQ